MNGDKIETFIALSGREAPLKLISEDDRKLGAQLLLSELLEYIIKGLGVTPIVDGVRITNPEGVHYEATKATNSLEMLDGLADVAYTMYWNAISFGVKLEEGFELVCDNNLEKFVKVDGIPEGPLEREQWGCGIEVTWPSEVVEVSVKKIGSACYAVGKDARGKVRKPSTYTAVDLRHLCK